MTQAGAAQTSTLQSDEHPSPETGLPSSHSSPAIGEVVPLMSWSPLPQALLPVGHKGTLCLPGK